MIGSGELELLVYEIRWLDRFDEASGNTVAFSAFEEENQPAEDSETEGVEDKKPRLPDPLIGAEYIEEENEQANVSFWCPVSMYFSITVLFLDNRSMQEAWNFDPTLERQGTSNSSDVG